jgi:ornithine carbamoyltransferase
MHNHTVSPDPLPPLAAGHLRSDLDLSSAELRTLLDLAVDVKARPAAYATVLRGAIVSLLFEKPSLRTRITFEVAPSAAANPSRTSPATSPAGPG